MNIQANTRKNLAYSAVITHRESEDKTQNLLKTPDNKLVEAKVERCHLDCGASEHVT